LCGPIDAIKASVGALRLRSGRGRELREAAGLSVRQLARELDVDAATLSRWERGESRPRTRAASRWVALCQEIEHLVETGTRSEGDPGALTPGSPENVAAKQLPDRDLMRREGHASVE
jgi:transcriptional regulator with XRE-family HTH domain